MSGGVREIPLSRGRTALVDADDYERVGALKWRVNGSGYVVREDRAGQHALARVILGAERGQVVDHISGDKLDNRRANIRICTPAGNARNRGMDCRNQTGFKGVVHGRRGRFRAQIGFEGRVTNLGEFATAAEAARAYDAAAKRLHGEFARLNFPDDHRDQHPALRSFTRPNAHQGCQSDQQGWAG